MHSQKEAPWQDAKRRCRLSDEEVRMAKQLGFEPKSLIRNIPSTSEQWKAPVNEWVRSLYEKETGAAAGASAPRAKMAAITAEAENAGVWSPPGRTIRRSPICIRLIWRRNLRTRIQPLRGT